MSKVSLPATVQTHAERAGVLHLLKPIVEPSNPIMHAIEVNVAAGQPVEVSAEGPGIDELCTSVLHLGQVLEPFRILLKDDAGVFVRANRFGWKSTTTPSCQCEGQCRACRQCAEHSVPAT